MGCECEHFHCVNLAAQHGIQPQQGVYFDGHEREDVVAERKAYLDAMKSYESRMWKFGSPCPNPTSRPVICIFHDESTFYANADQTFHWTDGTKQVLKQKSLGQAIMVSDFVEEVGGLLEFEGEKACLLLEHQTQGYFNNEMLIAQVSKHDIEQVATLQRLKQWKQC